MNSKIQMITSKLEIIKILEQRLKEQNLVETKEVNLLENSETNTINNV